MAYMDNTTIHPASAAQAHRVDLHLWRGAPQNADAERPVQILVNGGFVVGFSQQRLQPVWSAYRVAGSSGPPDFDHYEVTEPFETIPHVDPRAAVGL